MQLSIFLFLIFGLQIVNWSVGRLSSKNLKGKDDYFLAGKSVKLFPLMMTFMATQVGGGMVLGAAEEAYQYGWPVLLYPLGGALGLIFLGSGVGRRLAGFRISTIAQIFEVVYRSPVLKRATSLLSVVCLFMILVAQIIASNKFLISLGFNNTPLFIIFWAIVILYTVQGGLKAVISTDMVQATFFSVVFLLCLGFVLYGEPSVAQMPLPRLMDCAPVSSKLWGWLLMPLLFMVIEQDMAQRCFAGASPRIVSKASLFAGFFMIVICIVPVFLGTLASEMALDVPQGGSVLMAVISKTTNPWIASLVGCAILAAVISTATSLINAISSNLSNDFKLTIFERVSSLGLSKGITGVISIAAIFFSFYFNNILDLLIQSYELSVSALFVPIFLALFKKQGSFLAALLSILAGTLGFFIFRLYPIAFPKEIATLLLSFFAYWCGERISENKQLLQNENR